jgi:hypothetical protein
MFANLFRKLTTLDPCDKVKRFLSPLMLEENLIGGGYLKK